MLLAHLIALTLACRVLARPPVKRVPHESRRSLPSGWAPVRRARPEAILPISVGLTQSNLRNLEAYLMDVADPDSPNYSNHWTPSQVAQTFKPSAESVDAVLTWLVEDGLIAPHRIVVSSNEAWVNVNVSVKEAEHLLGTTYFVYTHADSGREHIACESAYHLPVDIAPHVDIVTPTLHFDVKASRHSATSSDGRPIAKNVGSVGFGASPQMGGKVNVSSHASTIFGTS